jgi:hypothetical protein
MQRRSPSTASWRAFIAALLAWFAAGSASAQEAEAQRESWQDVPRVVVFGDVHGAYDALVELLRSTGVVGADLRWTAGSVHVVSLGDLLDRGPDVREVLELIMRLQQEARAAGGRLHVVLGNHELMNLIGDWRYVAAEEYATFAPDERVETRAAAYAAFELTAEGGDPAATRARFERAFPPGYFARQAAFAPTGRYGAWLLTLPTIVVVNDTAYVHGGLPSLVAEAGLELNTRVRMKLERYLALRDQLAEGDVLSSLDREHDLATARAALPTAAPNAVSALEQFVALGDAVEFGGEGPLWYRGSLYCKPLLEEPTLAASLAKLGAERVIVGHTPTGDRRAHSLYGGRLIAADTGMFADYFRGRPAALVIERGAIEVQYLGSEQHAAIEGDASSVVYGATHEELLAALERGEVTGIERADGAGPWRVSLQHEGATIEAVFFPRGRDRTGDRELAAAALDDLLGTELVPPTVARALDGEEGALQLRHQGTMTEAERAARGLPFSGWCPIEPQLALMYTFDTLASNAGRSADNVLFSNDLTDLELTDHRQAFGTDRALPSALDTSRLAMPAALVARLRALDERRLTTALGGWLDGRRVRALLARRDALLRASTVQ